MEWVGLVERGCFGGRGLFFGGIGLFLFLWNGFGDERLFVHAVLIVSYDSAWIVNFKGGEGCFEEHRDGTGFLRVSWEVRGRGGGGGRGDAICASLVCFIRGAVPLFLWMIRERGEQKQKKNRTLGDLLL